LLLYVILFGLVSSSMAYVFKIAGDV